MGVRKEISAKESFNKPIADVETILKLILRGLLNFSCGGNGWVGVEN